MIARVTEEDRLEVADTRASAAAEAALEPREHVDRVDEVDAGGVPCRLYAPRQPRGLLLYLHGGGFVYGDLDTHDAHCRRTVNRSGWAVLAVHYRRAPEDPFPAAVDDATAAADWLVGEAGGLAGDGPVAVAGDSAGANLALTVAAEHRGAFAGQLLVYPFLDVSCATYDRGVPDPDFPVATLAWFWRLYLRSDEDAHDARADPLRLASYAGLPPTFVQLAELDVLTPTGRLLARRLVEDGVPVDVEVYPGVGHGFWRHDDNEQHDPAQRHVAAFLARLEERR